MPGLDADPVVLITALERPDVKTSAAATRYVKRMVVQISRNVRRRSGGQLEMASIASHIDRIRNWKAGHRSDATNSMHGLMAGLAAMV
jgi:hypothetical protein